jgi:hypothetical protein
MEIVPEFIFFSSPVVFSCSSLVLSFVIAAVKIGQNTTAAH